MAEENGDVEVKLVFPITVNLKGVPVARLHADGKAEGRVDALQAILANYRTVGGAPDSNAMTLWLILHALMNQKIIGTGVASEIKAH